MDFDPFPLITKWAFFIYLAAPRPTLRLLTRRQSHLPNVIIQCTCLTWPKSQREPCNEVGSQSPTKLINGIRTGTLSIPSEQAIPLSLMSHEEKKQLERQLQFNSHKFWRVTFFTTFYYQIGFLAYYEQLFVKIIDWLDLIIVQHTQITALDRYH